MLELTSITFLYFDVHRPIVLMEVPKEKKDILETKITRDTCGYGIYPGLHLLEKAGAGQGSMKGR